MDSSDERLKFDSKFDANPFYDRDSLVFIRLEKGLCCPASTKWGKAERSVWVKAIRAGERFKSAFEKAGVSCLSLTETTGGGQSFQLTRTGGFTILSPEDFAAGTIR